VPIMLKPALSLAISLLAAGAALAQTPPQRPHNVILFVPDGLRALKVTKELTPAMAAVRDEGVNFKNSHSLFPTFTTANASAMATGHYLGDSGDFSNTIYTGFPVLANKNNGNVTPFIENDQVLAELDDHFGENYLNEEAILKLARLKGFSTAAIGKLGPTFIFDHTAWSGIHTIVIDDATGTTGVPLSEEVSAAMKAAGLSLVATKRQDSNGNAGSATTPGATQANIEQQDYFVKAATDVVLPLFKKRDQPFFLVYWSRDPDGTQHNQSDGNLQLTPGINGPTSHKGIQNADNNLKRLRDKLTELGLADTTDIIVAADHGFSVISKESKTSPAAQASYGDAVPKGFLPLGFVAIDLAKALNLPLFETLGAHKRIEEGMIPTGGNGLIGADPAKPEAVVAANGGSDLVYLTNPDPALAARIVQALLAQDYVSGIFVRDDLGPIPGTLAMSDSNLKGTATTPTPAIAINFRSWSTGCEEPLICTAEVADTPLQQGQGMHGSYSRADTNNFMAAIGPDFRKGFVDDAPVSNADVGKTIAHILALKTTDKGSLIGRVMSEAFVGGTMPTYSAEVKRSTAAANGLQTVLRYQVVDKTLYFDAAGFPGRSVGVPAADKAAAQ
jgi:arylsulfatase A-like enzyme